MALNDYYNTDYYRYEMDAPMPTVNAAKTTATFVDTGWGRASRAEKRGLSRYWIGPPIPAPWPYDAPKYKIIMDLWTPDMPSEADEFLDNFDEEPA